MPGIKMYRLYFGWPMKTLKQFEKIINNFLFNLTAPNGCLQYFPQPSGVIESFNYNNRRGPYLPNQDYAICFRKRSADTKIT